MCGLPMKIVEVFYNKLIFEWYYLAEVTRNFYKQAQNGQYVINTEKDTI